MENAYKKFKKKYFIKEGYDFLYGNLMAYA